MSVSDPRYLLFLSIVFVLFYQFRAGEPRRLLLLAASYYFYFEFSQFYIAVLFLVTLVTYYGACWLQSAQEDARKVALFWSSIGIVCTPLLVLKYAGVILASTQWHGVIPAVIPVGISFFTFVALGYIIDVYLEVVPCETSLTRVALLLAFFPLVSAGPIERGGSFLPQFDLSTKFSADRAFAALRLIFIGLILKIVFANNLEGPLNSFYEVPGGRFPIEYVVGPFFYAFYLYSDFAGYSLIAIGSAKLLGLEVRPNFKQPFLSATLPEFWRCWHMSLSFWLRDYVFAPLRMEWRRLGNVGMAAALFVSFVGIGVWHGAKWGFFWYGAMHGVLVIASAFTLARRDAFWQRLGVSPKIIHVQRVLATFILVMLSWVVFRAENVSDALLIYRNIFSPGPYLEMGQFVGWLLSVGAHPLPFQIIFTPGDWILVLGIIVGDCLVRNKITLEKLPGILQVVIYFIGIILIVEDWLNTYVAHEFVYNKF
jgi:alginate O-acetyltransferase complex protein AlgI